MTLTNTKLFRIKKPKYFTKKSFIPSFRMFPSGKAGESVEADPFTDGPESDADAPGADNSGLLDDTLELLTSPKI